MNVGEAERPFLVAEAEALAGQLPDSDLRAALASLVRASEAGVVPEHLEERVGDLAALSIETGRAHSVHGPAGVRALTALWKDSPQGRKAAEDARDLEKALSALRGRRLDSLRLVPIGPGSHSIAISAGGYEIRLVVDRAGIRLRGVNVGGGGVGE